MVIKTIKRTNSYVLIRYEKQVTKKSKPEEHELKCQEAPLPSFDKALAALVPHVIEICGLGAQFNESRITAKGVSLAFDDDEMMQAIITASVITKSAPAPFTINTPRLPEKADDSFKLTRTCANAINKLVEEAANYVNGQRMQGVMLEIIKEKKPEDDNQPQLIGASK